MFLKAVYPEGINQVTHDGEWEEIEAAVDSGATESVTTESAPANVETKPGEASRKGVHYESACGTAVPTEGEKKFNAMTEEGSMKGMTLQVADINQTLLSVTKLNEQGRILFLTKKGK